MTLGSAKNLVSPIDFGISTVIVTMDQIGRERRYAHGKILCAPRFRCGTCDVESDHIRWRCPECGAWESWAS